MLSNYAFIGIFAIAAITFPLLPLILSRFIRPRRPTPIKLSTYECGLEAMGDIWVQFKVQYYLYALAFVVFDIETIYLYPWAVAYGQLGLFALIEMAIFLLILVAGLVYAWRKGALEWI
ncbi:MAG: NADH-quinone oxidoreductase subunit A [Chloroflexota bacterium]|nr:NADH-quinone oxidoreductase subunit A [Chloroflexota bacterium]PLS79694.1 MAG: NADH-quinone oxidoreductase subunit A [Chloroflexota bacterium]